MNKLELKHVVPYLPYGLKVYYSGMCDNDVDGVFTVMSSYYNDNGIGLISDKLDEIDLSESFFVYLDSTVKPILRPISSITEEEALELLELFTGRKCYNIRVSNCSPAISISGSTGNYTAVVFIDHNRTHATIYEEGRCYDVSLEFSAYEWLFKHHFDVFGLINKGLAVDKTELK